MEDELRCPVCKHFFNNPVLLPCNHALCQNCAVQQQQPAALPPPPQQPLTATATGSVVSATNDASSSENSGDCGAASIQADYPEVDKLSLLSETDSGVVCTSRPNSYVGTPSQLFPAAAALALACPVLQCAKVVYFDENGALNLPKYRVMQNIVDKYCEVRQLVVSCQLCETQPPAEATVLCEQCEVLYCEGCREACHPARGPLARHSLVEPRHGRNARIGSTSSASSTGSGSSYGASANSAFCQDHPDHLLSVFCVSCRVASCESCLQAPDSRHSMHDVQPLLAMCKAQKTELSQSLQQLSEKAKSATELIQRLKNTSEKVHERSAELEASVDGEVDALISLLRARRAALIEAVRADRERRLRMLRDGVTDSTSRLQKTTALLQFCIEALKEMDPVAFLQSGSMLIQRVVNTDLTCADSAMRSAQQSDLTLDDGPLRRAIAHLNFIQMKPPGPPQIIPEECSAENNSVTVAWQPAPLSCVTGYVLELDDGNGGEFRDVYCGQNTICTVDGLHFNSMYNARVRAFNSAGEGDYSELVGLQTAEVAWFTLDPCFSPELNFSVDHCSISCSGYEHRVALGTVGFSQGVHYWEFSVDRYDSDTDPSFGVARLDVAKNQMLGKDDKGWAMYIDRQRSWFVHNNAHEQRCEEGITVGSTVGVLLDLEKRTLSFYVNEEPQGPIAFHDLYGVFYPAVSLNRGVAVTLHSALDAPTGHEDS